jgi:hypothetical protein
MNERHRKSKPRLKGQGFDPARHKELMLLLLQVFPPFPAYLSADRQKYWGFLTG